MMQPFFCAGYDPVYMGCEEACLIVCDAPDDRGDEGVMGGCKWIEDPCCVCQYCRKVKA